MSEEVELGICKYNNNTGVTCYMNSILAILQQTPYFADYIISDNYYIEDDTENSDIILNSIVYQLFKIFKISMSNDNKQLTINTFRRNLAKKNSIWGNYQQQDSQEFLTFLLNTIEDEIKESILYVPGRKIEKSKVNIENLIALKNWKDFTKKEYSIVKELFTGQNQSILECENCKNKSSRFEIFTNLQLNINNKCFDIYDYDSNSWGKRSDKMENKYQKDLVRFYQIFTGKRDKPYEIKSFSQIESLKFHNLKRCQNLEYFKDLLVSKNDKLFKKYMEKIENIQLITQTYKKKLLHILKSIFIESNTNSDTYFLISPELNMSKLIQLQEQTKAIDDLNVRIGIHEGEISLIESDIFGDDVNIASRIEKFSPEGGIAISGKVQQNISSLPEYKAKLIGTPQLK